MDALSWILLGLVAGVIARIILPRAGGAGFLVTLGIGIVGAVVGGYVGRGLGLGDVTGFNVPSLLLSVGGAIFLLVVFGILRGGRV